MYYQSSGSGRPSIVFVHGFTCDHTDWRLQIDALQEQHQVVACDLRGHGRTPGDPHDCTIATYGSDVAGLITALDLGPSVLVGHSLGCRVVLEAARTHPTRVFGLVLVDGSYTASGDPTAAAANMRATIHTRGYRDFAEERFQDMFTQPYAGKNAILTRARNLPEAIGAALFPNMVQWDAEWMDVALASLRVPLTVIQSTYMGPDLKRASLGAGQSSPWLERVRKAVPSARISVIPGIGHFTQLEAAEQVNALIKATANA